MPVDWWHIWSHARNKLLSEEWLVKKKVWVFWYLHFKDMYTYTILKYCFIIIIILVWPYKGLSLQFDLKYLCSKLSKWTLFNCKTLDSNDYQKLSEFKIATKNLWQIIGLWFFSFHLSLITTRHLRIYHKITYFRPWTFLWIW